MTSKSDAKVERAELPPNPLPRFRLRLVGLLLLAAVLPLIGLTVISSSLLYNSNQRQATDRLYTTAGYRQVQLDRWIDGLTSALIKLASATPSLPDTLQRRNLDKPAILQAFSSALGTEGLSEIMLLSEDDRVQLSTRVDRVMPPSRTCPARIICAFEFATEGSTTRLIVQYPLVGEQGQQVGAIVGLADTAPLDAILSNRAGLGASGVAYLVSGDGGLRWLPGYGVLSQKQISVPRLERAVLPSEPMTYSGLSGKSVEGIATSILRLNAWLIVEQPLDEIYQTAATLPLLALALVALVLAVIVIGSRLLTQAVTRPLRALTDRIAQLDAALDNARDADQIRNRTIASMSHEFRTPINSILNFSGFLLDNLFGELTPDQAELIRQMHANSQHLLELINDLLDMSKIEAGQMRLFVTEFDPAPVFEQAIATLRSLTLNKPITIKADLPQTWPVVRGDRRRILQILLNLVSNAAKFTDAGTITLRVHIYATRLEVRIEDSGMGVDPADVPNLFEPFRQGYNALLLEKGGTGLGLPLSRIFARMHGGDLDYQPGDHGGALFIFWAPLDAIAYEQKAVKAV